MVRGVGMMGLAGLAAAGLLSPQRARRPFGEWPPRHPDEPLDWHVVDWRQHQRYVVQPRLQKEAEERARREAARPQIEAAEAKRARKAARLAEIASRNHANCGAAQKSLTAESGENT